MIESEAIGNPIKHEFANGASYTFSELTFRQQGQMQSWIRSRRLKLGLDGLGSDASSEDRAALIRILLKPLDATDIQAEVGCVDGMLYALWLASDATSRLSPEQFADSLGNVQAPELLELTNHIYGNVAGNEEEAESGPNLLPTTAKAAS